MHRWYRQSIENQGLHRVFILALLQWPKPDFSDRDMRRRQSLRHDVLRVPQHIARLKREAAGVPAGNLADDIDPIPVSVLMKADYLFDGSDALEEWLKAPAEELGRQRPIDLLGTEDGVGRVAALLDHMHHSRYG